MTGLHDITPLIPDEFRHAAIALLRHWNTNAQFKIERGIMFRRNTSGDPWVPMTPVSVHEWARETYTAHRDYSAQERIVDSRFIQ